MGRVDDIVGSLGIRATIVPGHMLGEGGGDQRVREEALGQAILKIELTMVVYLASSPSSLLRIPRYRSRRRPPVHRLPPSLAIIVTKQTLSVPHHLLPH